MGNHRCINRTLVTWFSIEDWRRAYSRTINYRRYHLRSSTNQRKTITVGKGVAKSATPFIISLYGFSYISIYTCIP